jgi:DNA-binding LacI/PurR family transcriptional regulator
MPRTRAATPSPPPAFLRLKQILRQGILDGTLGDRLPPERELARLHSMAYMTARRAVDALVEERLVRRVPGQGTFVSRGSGPIARSGNIAILISPTIRFGAANPYYGEVVAAILNLAQQHRQSAFVSSTCAGLIPRQDDPESRRKVDGIIALGGDATMDADLMEAAQFVPIVRINRVSEHPRIASIRCDDRAGGRAVASHLAARGYRRIAWIGHASASAQDRLDGFREGLVAAGLDLPAERIAHGDYEFSSGEREALRLLARSEPPDAIACANDAMACGALRAAITTGRRIPQDVAISGFDALILDGYLPWRPTTAGVDKSALAAAAFATLMSMHAGGPGATVILPVTLCIGETT